jgi:predicted anti-sigma-YlaC factor YlaD
VFCDEVLEQIEPIAAGELTPDGRIAAHLESCGDCRAVLEDARHVDAALRARPRPSAPPQFTARTMARVRRERWRSEQAVDLGFNLTLAAVAVAVVIAGWLLLRLSGLGAVGDDAASLVGAGVSTIARLAAPQMPLYAAAVALLAAALGIWWWAERDASA